MELQPDRPRSLAILPVVYVGPELAPAVIRALRSSGIGLLGFSSARPALRLLQQCRVQAILYGGPSAEGLDLFGHTGTPLIVLAGGKGAGGDRGFTPGDGEADWAADGAIVIDAHSDPTTMAALIRHTLLERVPWIPS